jgi:hypothetical protein
MTARHRLLLIAAMLAGGCSGQIGGGDEGAGGASSNEPGAGPGASGTGPGGANPGGTGPGYIPAAVPLPNVATPRLSRLSHTQWGNSVRDLLKLSARPGIAGELRPDAVLKFDNAANELAIDDALRADYERGAETLASQVARDPAALARILPAGLPADLKGRATGFLRDFGLHAYRRPLTDDEVTRYLALFNRGIELVGGTDAFAAGVELLLRFFLQSPHFLYREELSTAVVAGRVPLGDYEVAAKLSYALTSTMPDAGLFAAAARGGLRSRDGVRAEVDRLLGSAAVDAMIDDFHTRQYKLADYDNIAPDAKLFPLYNSAVPQSMRQEALLYLRDVVKSGHNVRDLLQAPYTFVDSRLAPIYGLSGTFGKDFTRVDLDPATRAGMLTRVGFLAAHAGRVDPEPITRGVFINEMVLCRRLPPPDPNAAQAPNQPGKTNRERVEKKTGVGTCGEACHAAFINPIGFALENYDALGRWRTTDNGYPVDATGTYPFSEGPASYNGPIELSRQLARAVESHACYASTWLSALHGLSGSPDLDPLLGAAAAPVADQSARLNAPVKALLTSIVTGDAFLTRAP